MDGAAFGPSGACEGSFVVELYGGRFVVLFIKDGAGGWVGEDGLGEVAGGYVGNGMLADTCQGVGPCAFSNDAADGMLVHEGGDDVGDGRFWCVCGGGSGEGTEVAACLVVAWVAESVFDCGREVECPIEAAALVARFGRGLCGAAMEAELSGQSASGVSALEELVFLWVGFAPSGCVLWLRRLCGVEGAVGLDCLNATPFGGGKGGLGLGCVSFSLLFGLVLAAFFGGVCSYAGGYNALDADGAVAEKLGDGLDVPFDGGAGTSWVGGLALPGGDVGEDWLEVWSVGEEVVECWSRAAMVPGRRCLHWCLMKCLLAWTRFEVVLMGRMAA